MRQTQYWDILVMSLASVFAPSTYAEDKLANPSYYVERRSYGTLRDTEPPRYVKQLNKTWLRDDVKFADVDWLDIGLDYRFRYEYRDNDFRRSRDSIDEPFLLRTRGYLGVKTYSTRYVLPSK